MPWSPSGCAAFGGGRDSERTFTQSSSASARRDLLEPTELGRPARQQLFIPPWRPNGRAVGVTGQRRRRRSALVSEREGPHRNHRPSRGGSEPAPSTETVYRTRFRLRRQQCWAPSGNSSPLDLPACGSRYFQSGQPRLDTAHGVRVAHGAGRSTSAPAWAAGTGKRYHHVAFGALEVTCNGDEFHLLGRLHRHEKWGKRSTAARPDRSA